MFREILGLLLVILIVKFAFPHEVGDLVTQILLQVLTVIRDAVSQIH